MKVSQRIFELLNSQGKSQKEFANFIGISASAVTDWKGKGTNPSIDYIIKICEFLDVTPYYLLTGQEEPLNNKDLTQNEREILTQLHKLEERNQVKLIGKVEQIVKEMSAE